MSSVAHIGTRPDFPIFQHSLAEFILSDPFKEGSKWIKEGSVSAIARPAGLPDELMRLSFDLRRPACNAGHVIKSRLPEEKAALINSVTGALSLFQSRNARKLF